MSSKSPEISVIVPVYNVEKYLEECIDSLLAQTFKNLEIILVDDGSTDTSGQICDRYAENHPEIIRVIHKNNGGLSSARNAGMDIAKGRYLGFVDSDDAILPAMYEDLYNLAKNHGADIIDSYILKWDNSINKKISGDIKGIISGEELFRSIIDMNSNSTVWNKLFKRELIGSLRFIDGITNEDLPFQCNLLLSQDVSVYVTDSAYYRYRETPGSITHTLKPSFFDIFKNTEYLSQFFEKNNVSDSLGKSLKSFILKMHIMSGVRIISYKKKKEYRDWLRKNRRYILNHIPTLLFGRRMSMRWRLKALYALVF